MEFGLGTYGIGFAAGSLSILSPCVLPLLPVLIGAAASAHRRGPLALAAGLTLSFAVLGVLLAGAGAGLDQAIFRNVAALMLLGFGVLLLSTGLQERFAIAASGASSAGQGLLARVTLDGLSGQFVLGLLLGVVWSPCVGPTLGATITLASQGRQLTQVMLVMALFGLGAGLPLVILGSLSRQTMLRLRGKLLALGRQGKKVFGAALLLLAISILSGLDKQFEIWVLDFAPAWLSQIGTSL